MYNIFLNLSIRLSADIFVFIKKIWYNSIGEIYEKDTNIYFTNSYNPL